MFKKWFSNLSAMQAFWFHVALILFVFVTVIHNPTAGYDRVLLYFSPVKVETTFPSTYRYYSIWSSAETDRENGLRYLEYGYYRNAFADSGMSAEAIGAKMREEYRRYELHKLADLEKAEEWIRAMEWNGWRRGWNSASDLSRPRNWIADPRGWDSKRSIVLSWLPDLTNLFAYLITLSAIFSLTGVLGWLAGIRANVNKNSTQIGVNSSSESSGSPAYCPSCDDKIAAPLTQPSNAQEIVSVSPEAPANLRTPAHQDSPGLPVTATKAGSSFGGKIFSFVGKMLSLLITGIIVLVLGRSIGGYIGKQAAERELAKRSTQAAPPTNESSPSIFDFESILPDIVSKMNESMPMKVDRDTRIDRVSSGPGNKITFHYSFTRLRISDFDRNEMITGLRKQIIEGYKSNPNFKYLQDNNVTFEYSYVDVDGNYFTTISIAPDDVD